MRARVIAGMLLAVGVVAVGFAQGPGGPGKPDEPAKPVVGTWEVKYTDDSTMKLTLLEDAIAFVTPHGTLQIPIKDVKRIEFGVRLTDADQKAVDAALADLGGTDSGKWEKAKAALLELGVKALPAVDRAAKKQTGERRADFTQVADTLLTRLSDRKVPRDTDVIHTDESVIAGRVSAAVLRVNTFQFGEQKLKVTDVAVMQFGKLEVAGRTENVEIVEANTLTTIALQRVGQTVGVRVTGANNGAVWGSGPYTSDSTLGMAAVHAGVLKVGETGVVRIKFVPSPPAFGGSTQNGITTSPFGAFGSGSYEIVRQP